MRDGPLRLKSYNVTGPADTVVKLNIPVGYVWLIQQVIVATDDATDAAKPAVVYTGRAEYDSIVAAADTIGLTAASVATFTLNGAVEFQENYILGAVEGSVGRVSLTVFVEEKLLSEVRGKERAPGLSESFLVASAARHDGMEPE